MLEIAYCKRCGLIKPKEGLPTDSCPICKYKITYGDISFLDWYKMQDDDKEKWRNEHIIHDEYTESFMMMRKQDERQSASSLKNTPTPQPTNIPHCPICGSADLKKLSTVGKAAKIGIFGIFGAGSLGKTYKCNNCGVKF